MRKVLTKSRRERRQEAKEAGVPFQPRYHDNMAPKSYEEYYGNKEAK